MTSRIACVLAAVLTITPPGLRLDAAQPVTPPDAAQRAPNISARPDPATDRAIARRLADIYSALDGLDQVRVIVRAGVVHLSGEVVSQKAREQAVKLARQVEGVVEVEEELRVAREIKRQIAPVFSKLGERVDDFIAYLPLIAVAVLVMLAFWSLASLVGRWDRLYRRFTSNPLLRDLARQFTRTAILIFGLVIAFEILDATALIGAVLGAAGLLGVALGFALRDTVENYIAGILLSLRQPFTHHDRVKIGDFEGAVVRMTPRATMLMTLDGNHVRIPNARVFNGILVNYTRNPERRFEFDVGVSTGDNLSVAQALAAKTLAGMDGVLAEPPPRVDVAALGDSTVTLRVYGWVDQRVSEFEKVRSEATRLVKEAFDAAGVVMPEPTYQVRIRRGAAPAAKAAGPRRAIDIARRTEIDNEIADDRSGAREPDLLRPDAPQE